jgi:hypothetical protein
MGSADEYPPITNSTPRTSLPLALREGPYITASAACCATHEVHIHAHKKAAKAACLAADLQGICCQRAKFDDMEARLLVLMQGTANHDMGDQEEETATRRVSKKISGSSGGAAASTSAGTAYSSPARRSKSSNKQNQISSLAANFATGARQPPSPDDNSTGLVQYFKPGGGAEQEISDAARLANCVLSREQIDSSTIDDFGAEGVEEAFSWGNIIVSHV